MWTSEWIGLRYQKLGRGPSAYDCLGLYLTLHRHRLGCVLPDPQCSMEQAARQSIAETMRPLVRLVRAADVQEGDALMFRVRGQLLHVGYALGPMDMLHIEEDATGSVLENWTRSPWAGRLEGIYRFAG